MKIFKYAILFVSILLSMNCTSAQSNENKTKTNEDKTKKEIEDTGTGEVIVLDKADFLSKIYNYEKNSDKWVYEGTTPCIIDFYADWCGPCKKVGPILKELAEEYKGKIIVYKINIDQERELASIFGVRSIPAFFFIPAKGEPKTAMGAMPRESFVSIINDFLLKDAEK